MIRQNWQLFSGSITPEECGSIVKRLIDIPSVESRTFDDRKDYRRSKIRWVHGDLQVSSLILEYALWANVNAFNVDIQPVVTEVQFTEYDSAYRGEYMPHHDINWNNDNNYDRKLSVVIQLSDPSDYVGGEFGFTEVENPDPIEIKKQGTVLVFPSYLQHFVKPVTSGIRYSLVSWISGPRWR